MKKTITLEEFKDKMDETLDAVHLHEERFVIVDEEKPFAALVPFQDFESWKKSMKEKNAERHKVLDELAALGQEIGVEYDDQRD